MARNIDRIQEQEQNLLHQVENQDKIIAYLKKRLKENEDQTEESFKLLRGQESTYQTLVKKLNETGMKLNALTSKNEVLEQEHVKDLKAHDFHKQKIADLKV